MLGIARLDMSYHVIIISTILYIQVIIIKKVHIKIFMKVTNAFV